MNKEVHLEFIQREIPSCEIEEHINKNLFCSSYRVHHKEHGECLLKIFNDSLTENRILLQKIEKEFERTVRVNHPNFAKVFHFAYEPVPHVIREWIPGASLEEFFPFSSVTVPQILDFVTDAALGLQAVYNFGARHKNYKLSNFILKLDGTVVLVDSSLPPTSPFYISPEHCRGKHTDIRSEIYSLGVMLYHCLSGESLFRGNVSEIMESHIVQEIPDISSFPQSVQKILRTTLSKLPDERYQSPLELIEKLRQAQEKILQAKFRQQEKLSSDIGSEDDLLMQEYDSQLVMYLEESNLETPVQTIPEKKMASFSLRDNKEKPSDESIETESIDEFTVEHNTECDVNTGEVAIPQSLPQQLREILQMITGVKKLKKGGKDLTSFNIFIDKKWENEVLGYLRAVLRRECWIIKETDEEGICEIELNLELVRVLRYFNHFEDKIQENIAKLPEISAKHKTFITQVALMEKDFVLDAKSTVQPSRFRQICSVVDSLSGIRGDDMETRKGNAVLNSDEVATQKGNLPDKSSNKEKKVMELFVNFNNPYQTRAWLKLVRELEWEKGKHFWLKDPKANLQNLCFEINLRELHDYERKKAGMSSVQEFFQGDYQIDRLDQGGMAVVLKLTTKSETTVILLRPENHWARHRFSSCLCVRKGKEGQEFVYAEVPKKTEFVVKIAFQGKEEELIHEARLLSILNEKHNPASHYFIGMVQQGSFLTSHNDDGKLGYYLMMEYAALGNLEQFSHRFSNNQLPTSAAFSILYSISKTLRYLKTLGIIHRDIKPQNILLTGDGIAKLSDFGLAITVDVGSQLNEERRRLLRLVDAEFLQITLEKEQAESRLEKERQKLCQASEENSPEDFESISRIILDLYQQIESLKDQENIRAEGLQQKYRPLTAQEIAIKGEFAGSVYYAAPEQFSPSKLLTFQCDVYQLGAVAYTMFTGQSPVTGRNISEVMRKILLGKKPKVIDTIPTTPFINRISSVIEQMMENDPEIRISVESLEEELKDILLTYRNDLLLPSDIASMIKEDNTDSQKNSEDYTRKFHQKILPQISRWIRECEEEIEKEQGVRFVYLRYDGDNPNIQLRFHCPSCRIKLQIAYNTIGKKIRCPNCSQSVITKKYDTMGNTKEIRGIE